MYKDLADTWLNSPKGKGLLTLWAATAGFAVYYHFRKPSAEEELAKVKDLDEPVENHLWKISHRLLPSWNCQVAKYTALIPVTMGIWYASRIKAKKINSSIISAIVK